jgi:hypothetical protein
MFLLLAASNGWKDWKTEDGVTLHEYQGRTFDTAAVQSSRVE